MLAAVDQRGSVSLPLLLLARDGHALWNQNRATVQPQGSQENKAEVFASLAIQQRAAVEQGINASTRSTLLQTAKVSASEKDERLQQQRYQRMTPLLQNNPQRTIIGQNHGSLYRRPTVADCVAPVGHGMHIPPLGCLVSHGMVQAMCIDIIRLPRVRICGGETVMDNMNAT